MSLEQALYNWTGPSSSTEREKQERTERMVRGAVNGHRAFDDCSLSVYAKGSYPNNTNVVADSDVDIAVQCHDVVYWREESPGAHGGGEPYRGKWTPAKLRSELEQALRSKFGDQVDTTGQTAIQVNSSTARVDADVSPCFDYKYYFTSGRSRDGIRIFAKTMQEIENFPTQHYEKGVAKNAATSTRFKKMVRILKRTENAMFADGYHREVPSYFIECLVYNCPNGLFERRSWVDRTKAVVAHIWEGLQGAEPTSEPDRWLEVNECKYLFHSAQRWSRKDGRDFAYAVWNYLDLADA